MKMKIWDSDVVLSLHRGGLVISWLLEVAAVVWTVGLAGLKNGVMSTAG